MPSVLDPVSRNIYVTVKPELASERLSDLGYEWILALLKEHGAILFRGFNLDLQQFEEIGNRFCSSFVTNSSPDRLKISTDGRIQSVYLGIAGLPMHAEISREPWKPDVLFFGCEKPLWFGGETMICDGICVAENLQPETRDLLARHELKYRHPTTKEKCEKWLGVTDPDSETLERLKSKSPFVFTIEKKDHYVRTFTTPALHKPMFSDKLAYGSFILVARYLHKLRNWPTFEDDSEIPDEVCEDIQRVCDEQTVRHQWEKHDLLMLDNTRFLHARPDIRRASKRLIWTQFGYANYAQLSKEEIEVQRWRRTPLWIEDEW